jgi:hypothetical protein
VRRIHERDETSGSLICESSLREAIMFGQGVSHPRTVIVGAVVFALTACSSSQNGGGAAQDSLGAGGSSSGAGAGGQATTNGGASAFPSGGSGNAPPMGTGAGVGFGGFPVNQGGTPGFAGSPGSSGNPGFSGTPGFAGTPGFGGTPIGGGGAPAGGSPGMAGGPPAGAGGSVGPSTSGCPGETLPAVTDYGANGPFATMVVNNTGSDGMYTVYRPSQLGMNGFKHPIATWGNGITTTPAYYPALLSAIASHGFVVIASNSMNVTAQLMTAGLDWMISQNATGDYAGKLNTTCLVTIGYSLGGGASVGAGAHKDVVATASMHGVTGPSNTLHAPLLLLTSQTDTFVVPATFVTPTYNSSTVQTFYGTLSMAADPSNTGHLIPVDLLPSAPNTLEHKAMVAWLRYWVYGDQGAKSYFFGDDCVLCKDPWTMPQRKNWH